MKFVISVYGEKKNETFPCGFGVLENSGNDLEEAAKGEVTIKGYTVQASLEMIPAPVPETIVNPNQIPLDLLHPLQPAEA